MSKQKTRPPSTRWRYFTADGKRKKDLKIVTFTGQKDSALLHEKSLIVTYYGEGFYELRLDHELV
jgi:hypothetical protein